MRIEGKSVVITGAAGGIGAAIAEAFVQEGAKGIVIADLDEEKNSTGKHNYSLL